MPRTNTELKNLVDAKIAVIDFHAGDSLAYLRQQIARTMMRVHLRKWYRLVMVNCLSWKLLELASFKRESGAENCNILADVILISEWMTDC